ncbi:bacteriohemerythrin [Myxococcota bacterium]|nr:bacteriohemerythrin [Myxococcota bacterium]
MSHNSPVHPSEQTLDQRIKEALALARGDLSVTIVPHAADDELGHALKKIAESMRNKATVIELIAGGVLSTQAELASEDDNLGKTINRMAKSLKDKIQLTETVEKGELSYNIELASESDELGKALQNMVASLQSKLEVLEAIALGDMSMEVELVSPDDELGLAFQAMLQVLRSKVALAESIARGDLSKKLLLVSEADELGKALQAMVASLQSKLEVLEAIALGDMSVEVELVSEDDELGLALQAMLEVLKNKVSLAESIARGDLSTELRLASEQDFLGLALLKTRESLKNKAKLAQAIAKGDFSMKVQLASKSDELGKSLQIMADSLATMQEAVAQKMKEKSTIIEIFEKFVPKQFLNRIAIEGLEKIQLGSAESDNITILFSDIRSFTTLSENLAPQDLLDLLNAYFKRMNQPIYDNGGFVDKFIGDGIMALFTHHGISKADEARNAIKAAIGMQKALQDFNENHPPLGAAPLQMGIGVHTGFVVIGTVGSEDRMDSTVLGDAVNIAARLEGLTKLYQASILISSNTFFLLDNPNEFSMRFIDRVTVKGKTDAISVFEVFDADSPHIRERKFKTKHALEDAISLFYLKQFDKAHTLLDQCLSLFPQDKTAQLYKERCEEMLLATEKHEKEPLSWRANWMIGVDVLDQQHEELFRRINTLFKAIEHGNNQEVIKVVQFLEEYVLYHFEEEERLMLEYGYPEYSFHLSQHHRFIEDFKSLKRECESKGSSFHLALRTQCQVVDWMIHHIAKTDRKLGKYLNGKLR